MHDLGGGPSKRPRLRPGCPLTKGERAALRGLARGQQYKEIAAERGTKPTTVRSHLHGAYEKLGVRDRAQAVLVATKSGWL